MQINFLAHSHLYTVLLLCSKVLDDNVGPHTWAKSGHKFGFRPRE